MDADFILLKLVNRITELERRLNNIMRPSRVADVFPDEYRVRLTDGRVTGPKIPWFEPGGAIGSWTPPSVGQPMVSFNPYGDLARGFAIASGFNGNNPPIDSSGDTHVISNLGAARLSSQDGGMTLVADNFYVRGNLIVEGDTLTHNGVNVGGDHVHTHPPSGTPFTGPPRS